MKKLYKYLGIFVAVSLFIVWYITQMRLEVIKEKALLYDSYFRYINYYYDEDIVLQFESEVEEELLTAILNLDWERKLLLDPSWYLNEHREGESLPTLKFFTCVKYKGVFRDEMFIIDGMIYGDDTKTSELYYRYKGVEYVYTAKNSYDVSKLKQ